MTDTRLHYFCPGCDAVNDVAPLGETHVCARCGHGFAMGDGQVLRPAVGIRIEPEVRAAIASIVARIEGGEGPMVGEGAHAELSEPQRAQALRSWYAEALAIGTAEQSLTQRDRYCLANTIAEEYLSRDRNGEGDAALRPHLAGAAPDDPVADANALLDRIRADHAAGIAPAVDPDVAAAHSAAVDASVTGIAREAGGYAQAELQQRIAAGEVHSRDAVTAAYFLLTKLHRERLAAARGGTPAPSAAKAPDTPEAAAPDKLGGWIVFAVGFVIAAAAMPLGQAITGINEALGIIVLLGLGIWGVYGMFTGLRQALGTGKGVTAVLVIVALNFCVMLSFGLMAAFGMTFDTVASEGVTQNGSAANVSRSTANDE